MADYRIKLDEIMLEDIVSIDLVLGRMEAVKVYSNEIVDLYLEFDNTLVLGGSGIERKVKSGYIRLAIDDKTKRSATEVSIFDENGDKIKKPYKKKVEERLVTQCDICYLVVTQGECCWQERIAVPYLEIEMQDVAAMSIGCNYVVRSSAKMDEDGNLLILLGDMSEFMPHARVYDQDNGYTLLATIEDYMRFWNSQSLETLKEIAYDHGITFFDKTTKEDLITLLRVEMEGYIG